MTSESTGEPSKSTNPAISSQRRRRLRLSLAIAGAAMLAVFLAGCGLYLSITGNLSHIALVSEELGDARPVKTDTNSLNILLIGSDKRDGMNAEYGAYDGERADVIMLAHVSSRRREATVISFPRDLLIQLPACQSGDGWSGQKKHLGMINSSFSSGGVGCLWKTVEKLTGVYIDHAAMVDFNGFKSVVDSVGGVSVCLPQAVRDQYSQLDLPAGWQTLRGEQALGYVRARYGIGDGTDIGRIQRQHAFGAAIVKRVRSGVLFNPLRLVGFLNAVARSISTDPGMTPGVMRQLAFSLLSVEHFQFITTPWRYSAAQPGRVEWRATPARKLFRSIANDQPIAQPEMRASDRTVALRPAGTAPAPRASEAKASDTPCSTPVSG